MIHTVEYRIIHARKLSLQHNEYSRLSLPLKEISVKKILQLMKLWSLFMMDGLLFHTAFYILVFRKCFHAATGLRLLPYR